MKAVGEENDIVWPTPRNIKHTAGEQVVSSPIPDCFANLIVDGTYVADRVKKDKVLATKVERMKELLTKFCPEMNEKFWTKVEKINRDDKK